jgi:predicted nucleic acid-binding protein
MKVLIDTNVALDILLNNAIFYVNSMAVYVHAEQKYLTGYISASAITDIYYIAGKRHGKTTAREIIKKMLRVFQPADVTGNDIYKALELEWGDFEDSVQFVVGEGLAVDYIITRNAKDFTSGKIPAVTPEQFIEIITGIE